MDLERQGIEPPELLQEAARLTRQWAKTSCTRREDGGWPCQAYHQSWTTLRLIGAISGARTDEAFFLEWFGRVAKSRPDAKVLIAGTADHAMLHMLLTAFRAEGGEPEVWVIDQCRTALAVNEWYAGQAGARIRTCHGALRVIDEISGTFDIITTHSIFSFIDAEQLEDVFRSFKNKLDAGGKLICAQGLHPKLQTGSRIRFSSDEASRFQDRVMTCFSGFGALPDLDEAGMRELVTGFVASKDIGAIARSEDIAAPLAKAGLRQEYMQEVRRSTDHYKSSTPDANHYAVSLRCVAVSAS
jgi:hypothetical protein